MGSEEDYDGGSRGAERFFGWTTILLFALLLIVTLVRAVIGWQQDPWDPIWDAVGGTFGLALLLYLGNGGAETALELKRAGSNQKLTTAAMVGRIGAGLLTLAFVGNFAAAIWEESKPIVLEVARDVIGGGFALCLIAYLALRFAERYRSRVVTSSSGGDLDPGSAGPGEG